LADYIGGHIKGAINAPSRTLAETLPSLVARLADKDTVVFHCALSQQRGPGAALKYLREKEKAEAKGKKKGKTSEKAKDGEGAETVDEEAEPARKQKVFVLDRGFVGWQEVFGEDERLTEGYRKELWKDGYWD
jgi:rhodanese-related sulfurtransferase